MIFFKKLPDAVPPCPDCRSCSLPSAAMIAGYNANPACKLELALISMQHHQELELWKIFMLADLH